jgi:RNA polymerase sigma-70 factor (ECF subfamily)
MMSPVMPAARLLDVESRSWVDRLGAEEPERGEAIAELHERLRREAAFHIRCRIRNRPDFPRSDIDDLAVQAADDALIALLRKLGDYRGDSQFWTWARRFAALEAPVSIRRRLGRDRVGISKDPDHALLVADPGPSVPDRAEARELLQTVCDLMVNQLTTQQRTVLTRVAVDGESTTTIAGDLHMSRGAVYKSLHDARVKLRSHLAA